MASRADVLSKLRFLEGEFARLVSCIDQADAVAAGKQARSIIDGIRAVLDSIQSSFAGDFIQNRLPDFETDRNTVLGYDQRPPTREDLDKLNRIAVHISKELRALDRLTCAVYPRSAFPIRDIAVRQWKKAAAALGVVLIGFLVASGYKSMVTSRQGLQGHYFNDMDLKDQAKERRDAIINFSWGEGSPLGNWRKSEFSIRWTGFLRVPRDDKWEFFTHSDDGVRLTLGDSVLIDDWNRHGTKISRAEVNLQAGIYPIKIEFFQHRKRALMKLYWKAASDKKPAIIPSAAFIPSREYLPSDASVFEVLDASAVVHATVIVSTPTAKAPAKPGAADKTSKKK